MTERRIRNRMESYARGAALPWAVTLYHNLWVSISACCTGRCNTRILNSVMCTCLCIRIIYTCCTSGTEIDREKCDSSLTMTVKNTLRNRVHVEYERTCCHLRIRHPSISNEHRYALRSHVEPVTACLSRQPLHQQSIELGDMMLKKGNKYLVALRLPVVVCQHAQQGVARTERQSPG